jgi:hypothetical protein
VARSRRATILAAVKAPARAVVKAHVTEVAIAAPILPLRPHKLAELFTMDPTEPSRESASTESLKDERG